MTAMRQLGPVAILLLSACQPAANTSEADRQVLRAQLEVFESMTTPDWSRYLGYFTDDAILYPPDRPAIFGKPAAQAFYEAAFGGIASVSIDYSEPTIDIAGDLAVRRYEMVGTAFLDSGDSFEARNKYIDVLRRQPNGDWKITVHAWSPNEALSR